MSRVILLCADHPLPLYAAQTRRVYFHSGVRYEEEGFSVQPHVYYRPAVDNLELSMKPHRYELDLRATEQDAALLRDYLRQSCIPGEQVELWNLWVSDIRVRAFSPDGPAGRSGRRRPGADGGAGADLHYPDHISDPTKRNSNELP